MAEKSNLRALIEKAVESLGLLRHLKRGGDTANALAGIEARLGFLEEVRRHLGDRFDAEDLNLFDAAVRRTMRRQVEAGQLGGALWLEQIHRTRRSVDRDLTVRDILHGGLEVFWDRPPDGLPAYQTGLMVGVLVREKVATSDGGWKAGLAVLPPGFEELEEMVSRPVPVHGGGRRGIPRRWPWPAVSVELLDVDARRAGLEHSAVVFLPLGALLKSATALALDKGVVLAFQDPTKSGDLDMSYVIKLLPKVGPYLGQVGDRDLLLHYVSLAMVGIYKTKPRVGFVLTEMQTPGSLSWLFTGGQLVPGTHLIRCRPIDEAGNPRRDAAGAPLVREIDTDPRRHPMVVCREYVWALGLSGYGQAHLDAIRRIKADFIKALKDFVSWHRVGKLEEKLAEPGMTGAKLLRVIESLFDRLGRELVWAHRPTVWGQEYCRWIGKAAELFRAELEAAMADPEKKAEDVYKDVQKVFDPRGDLAALGTAALRRYRRELRQKLFDKRLAEAAALAAKDSWSLAEAAREETQPLWHGVPPAIRERYFVGSANGVSFYRLADAVFERTVLAATRRSNDLGRNKVRGWLSQGLYRHLPEMERVQAEGTLLEEADWAELRRFLEHTLYWDARMKPDWTVSAVANGIWTYDAPQYRYVGADGVRRDEAWRRHMVGLTMGYGYYCIVTDKWDAKMAKRMALPVGAPKPGSEEWWKLAASSLDGGLGIGDVLGAEALSVGRDRKAAVEFLFRVRTFLYWGQLALRMIEQTEGTAYAEVVVAYAPRLAAAVGRNDKRLQVELAAEALREVRRRQ